MKLTYDPRHNIAYIRFHEKIAEVETIKVSDEMNVDLAPDGTVYGIELLNANEQLEISTQKKITVTIKFLDSMVIKIADINRTVRRNGYSFRIHKLTIFCPVSICCPSHKRWSGGRALPDGPVSPT